jgi:uncharacterized protein YggE
MQEGGQAVLLSKQQLVCGDFPGDTMPHYRVLQGREIIMSSDANPDTRAAMMPDLIHIAVSDELEVEADHAYLHVTVRGSSLFTGNAALTKAREVAHMVAELKAVGIEESNIHLQGVHAETTSVGFGKSSAAIYHLRLLCPRLTILGDVIGVITGQKQATLSYIEWGYSDNTAHDTLLETALKTANARAKRVAAALNVPLLGIHSCRDSLNDPEHFPPAQTRLAAQSLAPTRARLTEEDFGMELSHSKKVTLTVEVAYRVGGFIGSGDV